jgi:hypothetical protein
LLYLIEEGCRKESLLTLTSSAPDLLEACKVALTVFENVEMKGTYIKVLKDAIPKAEAN